MDSHSCKHSSSGGESDFAASAAVYASALALIVGLDEA